MTNESEFSGAARPDPVVLLVDSRTRDLDVATLIAHQFGRLGVDCHLEPLEAFRAVLPAYRPGMVIFNHLTASHLARWSRRLRDVGVLTAVLLNEGILYDEAEMKFNAGSYHTDAHIDFVFCWNEPHKRALMAEAFGAETKLEIVGVPRFDFYHEPWRNLVVDPGRARGPRPKILVCTNFISAKYLDLPREQGDKWFAPWKDRIPLYSNYWKSIEAHWKARDRFLDYVAALVASNKYDVVLRPHPREDAKFYSDWLARQSEAHRTHVRIDAGTNISALILDCDLEISCETCTTAIESWIVGKPTIELIFDRDPLWYREEQAVANVPCDDPRRLPEMADAALKNPSQPEKQDIRRRLIEKWCGPNDGQASRRVALAAAQAVRSKRPPDWSRLSVKDYQRAAKLRLFQRLGAAYHFDPLLPTKSLLFPKRYAIRQLAYEKAVKPRDVEAARVRLAHVLSGSTHAADDAVKS